MDKTKVFFIEDNRTEVLVLKLAFSGVENIEVKYFTKGQDLLDSLAEKPKIIVVDLFLPDYTGMDLIKKIKAHDSSTRIVVVSAQEDVSVIAQAQREGVYNYVVKSESCLKYLRQVIEDLLIIVNTKK